MAKKAAAPRLPGRPRGDLGTRERVLELAVPSFAEHGFAATSLRELAGRAGLTHASLLHHYDGKKALYGAVLERIADSLSVWAEPPREGSLGERLLVVAEAFLDWSLEHADYARILMRELLDNHERAARARRFYLSPFVRRTVELVEVAVAAGELERVDPAMLVVQLVGGVAYFVVAAPTLRRILGTDEDLVARFRASLRDHVESTLRAHAPSPARAPRKKRRP